MALIVPNSPGNYKEFFETLAMAHNNIRHNGTDRVNFTVVSLQSAMKGFSDDEVRPFLNSLKHKAAKKQTDDEDNCIMVLVEQNGEADDALIKIGRKEFVGSFCILMTPKDVLNATNIDEVKEICYQTGSDILAVVHNFFSKNYQWGKLTGETDEAIHINAHNLVGWRFDIAYYTNNSYCLTSSNFEEGFEVPTIPYPPVTP